MLALRGIVTLYSLNWTQVTKCHMFIFHTVSSVDQLCDDWKPWCDLPLHWISTIHHNSTSPEQLPNTHFGKSCSGLDGFSQGAMISSDVQPPSCIACRSTLIASWPATISESAGGSHWIQHGSGPNNHDVRCWKLFKVWTCLNRSPKMWGDSSCGVPTTVRQEAWIRYANVFWCS